MQVGKSQSIICFFSLGLLFTLFTLSPTTVQAEDEILSTLLNDGTTLELNGYAKANYLLNDFYLAALYLPQPSNDMSVITNPSDPKRMEIRILTKRFSARQFGQYWKETISINNPRDVLQPQIQNVLAFIKLFPVALVEGDVIDIDNVPAQGTLVSINKQLMGSVSDPQFYSLVLNAWIGPRPPNDDFKVNIVQGHGAALNADLQQQFSAVSPSSKRIEKFINLVSEKKAEIARLKAEEETKILAIALQKEQEENAKLQAIALTKQRKELADEKNRLKKIADDNAKKAQEEQAVLTKVQEIKRLAQEKLKLEQQNSTQAIQQRYLDVVMEEIRKKQTYPFVQIFKKPKYQKLMKKGQISSTGVFSVEINNEGKILDASVKGTTEISILDKHVVRTIKRIKTLPPIPEPLNLESLQFDIELSFLSPVVGADVQ